MSQTLSLWGATYSNVPGVLLPKSPSGTALFTDVSPTTAAAADVASGKIFFAADGTQTTGTASGGGGGSAEIETGTFTPTADIAQATITFSNTHTKLPVFAMMVDADGYLGTSSSIILWRYINWEQLIGGGIHVSSATTTPLKYGEARYDYRGNSTTSLTSSNSNIQTSEANATGGTNTDPKFWVTTTAMYPYSSSASRYWRANRTYKWMAVWMPTT